MDHQRNIASVEKTRPSIGLALGAGGTRGFAHLGVIEVLEQAKIPIDLIVGSSIGSLIGAMYAFRPKVAPNRRHLQNYLNSEAYDTTRISFLQQSELDQKNFYEQIKTKLVQGAGFALSLTKPALISEETLRKNVRYILSPVNIEDSLVKFAIVTFDLKSGQELVLEEGPLVEAVMASCAIPGIFPPIKQGDWQLMDGGVVNPIPCNHARKLGADVVIGVDLTPDTDPFRQFTTSHDVAMRAAEISRLRLKDQILKDADLVISVKATHIFWGDFSRFDDCMELGRQAALETIPTLRQLLDSFPKVPEVTT